MIEERLHKFIDVLNEIDFSEEFSQNQNVQKQDLERWRLDEGHGIFHSFFVAFFAYERISSESKQLNKIMASCLLHDFVKSTDNKANHDQRLKEYFPNLIAEVYTHANPQEETPLVIADRIELRRYSDWESWVNIDIKKYTQENEINHFYNNTRPFLNKDLNFINCMKIISKQLCLSCA